MSTIIVPNIKNGMNSAAFGTELTCPAIVGDGICGANQWKFVENIGMFRIRYRCKKCGKTIQYDYSANPGHPYEVFGKPKWQQIVDHWKHGQVSEGNP